MLLTHRCCSTIIKPFTATLADHDGLIPQIYTLFLAEILTVSAMQLADPVGHFNRHILAPRAATQDAMNLKFSGQPFELAERYTDMTKARPKRPNIAHHPINVPSHTLLCRFCFSAYGIAQSFLVHSSCVLFPCWSNILSTDLA